MAPSSVLWGVLDLCSNYYFKVQKRELDWSGWDEITAGLTRLMRRRVSVDAARRLELDEGLPIIRLTPNHPQLSPEAALEWVEERRARALEELARRLAEEGAVRSQSG